MVAVAVTWRREKDKASWSLASGRRVVRVRWRRRVARMARRKTAADLR
jgi:hypothetical protein